MKYTYSQAQGCYRWNMVQRITQEVGLEPIQTGDYYLSDGIKTIIEFTRELTSAEKTILDTLMANNPSNPPASVGTVFKISDIWEGLTAFNTKTGINFKLFYSESVPGSGKVDTIELHAPTVLTNTQKNKTKTDWAATIREA